MTLKLNTRCDRPAPTAATVGWCAGFFDGDGCISISKQSLLGRKNPTYRLRAVIAQNCLETLWYFQGVMDEQSFITRMADRPDQNRPMYMLVYEGRHALAVLEKMRPHMVRKIAGAVAAACFWKEGRMGTLPGPRGLPQAAWERREYWFKRLRRTSRR